MLEDQTKVGGQRFVYHPARIKINISAAADFVSLEYLQRIGLDFTKHLHEIPDTERRQIEGLNKVLHTPRHMIDLNWYRAGEVQVNTTSFFVISSMSSSTPEFDLLLSARRFVEAEERRLHASPTRTEKRTGKKFFLIILPSTICRGTQKLFANELTCNDFN